MKRLLVLCVVAVVMLCLAAWGVQAAEQVPALPDGVCAVIEIKDLNALSKQMEAYVGAVSEDARAMMPALTGQIANALKTTDADNLKLASPLRWIVLGQPLAPKVVQVFSVGDANAYFASLADAQAKGQDGNVKLYDGFAVGAVGKRIVLGDDNAAVQAALKLVEAGKIPETAMLPGDGASAVVSVTRLMAALKASSGDPFENLKKIIPAEGAAPEANVKAVLDAEVDTLAALVKQIDVAMLNIACDGKVISAKIQAQAVEGSGLARYIASVPAGEPALLKYLPADSWIAIAGKLGDLRPIVPWWSGFMTKMINSGLPMPAGAAGPDAIKTLTQSAGDLFASTGNDFAIGMSAKRGEPMTMVEVVSVKDAKAASQAMAKMLELSGAMMARFPMAGFEMKTESTPVVETYKGRTISRWTSSFEFKVPAGGAEGGIPDAAAMQNKVMQAVYGGPKMLTHWAFTDTHLLVAVGPDSLAQVKKLIDGQIAPLTESPAYKAALVDFPADLPKDRTGFSYVSLAGIGNWYLGILKAMTENNAGFNPMAFFSQIKFERGPGIMGASRWSGKTVEYNVEVPAAEISTLVTGFKEGMKGMMPPVPAPGAEPPPAPPAGVPPVEAQPIPAPK